MTTHTIWTPVAVCAAASARDLLHFAFAAVSSGRFWDVAVTLGLGVAAFAYARGLRTIWRKTGRRRRIRPWEAVCFYAGLAVIAVAVLSPLDRYGEALFSAHVAQHELLMIVAAPLVVLGRPLLPHLWSLPARVRERLGPLLRASVVESSWALFTGPLFATLLHGVTRWIWHHPVLFEAALQSQPIHALQHFTFFVTAALFWWAMVRGRYGKAGYGVSVLFVFATALHTSLLGALISVAPRVWYPSYLGTTSAYGMTALEDQELAGILMWVPTGIAFMTAALALFTAWIGHLETRAQGRRRALAVRVTTLDLMETRS